MAGFVSCLSLRKRSVDKSARDKALLAENLEKARRRFEIAQGGAEDLSTNGYFNETLREFLDSELGVERGTPVQRAIREWSDQLEAEHVLEALNESSEYQSKKKEFELYLPDLLQAIQCSKLTKPCTLKMGDLFSHEFFYSRLILCSALASYTRSLLLEGRFAESFDMLLIQFRLCAHCSDSLFTTTEYYYLGCLDRTFDTAMNLIEDEALEFSSSDWSNLSQAARLALPSKDRIEEACLCDMLFLYELLEKDRGAYSKFPPIHYLIALKLKADGMDHLKRIRSLKQSHPKRDPLGGLLLDHLLRCRARMMGLSDLSEWISLSGLQEVPRIPTGQFWQDVQNEAACELDAGRLQLSFDLQPAKSERVRCVTSRTENFEYRSTPEKIRFEGTLT